MKEFSLNALTSMLAHARSAGDTPSELRMGWRTREEVKTFFGYAPKQRNPTMTLMGLAVFVDDRVPTNTIEMWGLRVDGTEGLLHRESF